MFLKIAIKPSRTARDGDDYRNVLGGIDGRWRISDQHVIDFQHLQTETEYPLTIAVEFDQPLDAFTGRATTLNYAYNSRNWFGRLEFDRYSSGFRADSGFITQVGSDAYDAAFGHVWHGTAENWWSRIRASVHAERTVAEDGRTLGREKVLRVGFGGFLQSWFQFALVDATELWEGVNYDRQSLRAYAEMQPAGGISFGILGVYGDKVDYTNDRLGQNIRFQPRVTWNMTQNLLLRLQGVYSQLDTPDGDNIFKASVIDTRLTWQFNLRSFLRLTVQNTDIERNLAQYIEEEDARSRDMGRQLLYSYKLNPQTVLFLGYSDQYVDDDNIDGPIASDRTWFMKVGYAWTP